MTNYVLTETPPNGICGLAAVQNGRTLDELTDISMDRLLVCRMGELMTQHKVSIIHFREVVEDLLAQV